MNGVAQPRDARSGPGGAWTGGQYSLTRVLFGLYLVVHFGSQLARGATLPPASAGAHPYLRAFPSLFHLSTDPALVTALQALALAASLAVLVGWKRPAAAAFLGYLSACLFLHDPLGTPRCLPFLLLLHAALPPAPFGSREARGRTDPGHGWHVPNEVWIVGWLLMAATYALSAYGKLTGVHADVWRAGTALAELLDSPLARGGPAGLVAALPSALLAGLTWMLLGLQLAAPVLALSRRTRPILWTGLLLAQVAALVLTHAADVPLAMLCLHLFTFDPRWIPARVPAEPEWVYYDGECGLCHHTVRFVIAEDTDGAAFRFATQQGETFRRNLPEGEREGLPDAIVLQRTDGSLLLRSDSVVAILHGLGGLWGIAARLLHGIPRPLRDTGYDLVARVRKRIFKAPDAACPLMPPHLGARFAD